MPETLKIAIADDSAVIRSLIEEIVRYEPGFELVAGFDNGRDIVAWVREGGRADVFVIDMRLPGLSGTATIAALRRYLPDVRMLAFSASAQEESVSSAMAAGANGYLLKESSLGELLDAISATERAGVPAFPQQAPRNNHEAHHGDGDDRGEGLTVLVIDDHDLVREALGAMLESKQFTVNCCESAGEARAWLTAGNHCDAALVDLRLGDESGADMVKEFRKMTPNAAVILHSGAADQDGERIMRETGADGFLAKGDYTIEEMVSDLTAAIDRRRVEGSPTPAE
ncbi:MAG: response regulator [Actinobacteria bacterium]|nr:response regulator [Actinomycetota bacterium]